jgi:ketosteroid isomerase-like protein|tara:strand:+ start:543 stop:1463 length:921 start_codon:yes stop_codon:yes gene_type:complete
MKKLLLVFTMLFSVAVFSQKESNGKLYIEHPAIEIVNQFNEAYTSGDLDKLKELVTENFQVRTLKDRKSNDINWILGTSNYLSKNIVDLEIKHYGGSYPDVLEYKQDGIVDVKTYEWLTGYDKNTGLDINMPRYATYRMNAKGDKVAGLWINDDETLWQKNWDAYETTENGVIYKDHPLVSKVRLLYQSYKTGDVEKIKANYTENTIFYDVMNSEIDEFKTLEEEFAQFDEYMEVFEIVNIRESGFPDVLDYSGDGAVVISWADFTFKNKKSGNTKTISQHIQHWFNEEGEIVREDYYFNPAQLPQ